LQSLMRVELAASLLPVSESIEWHDVRREPLTVLLSTNDGLSRRRLPGHDFEPDIVARSSQIDFIVELAAVGLGVAFLPQMIAEIRLPSIAVSAGTS